jgi:hypothetical protein
MELKWFAFIMVGMPLVIGIGMSIDSYNLNKCREAGIQAKMPADEIAKVCKRAT